MVSFKKKSDFLKSKNYLKKISKPVNRNLLDRFGKEGVVALASATPKDSGKTASSWYYKIEEKGSSLNISFRNSNIQNGVPIAIILQYGHATKNGGWVQGRNYINPAIRPVFDRMAKTAWKEVNER